ncbi:MAG: hypothetical protein J6T14_07105 [Clostridia bacterium]|nr:hypothetical protein [Clostridia bacterium]
MPKKIMPGSVMYARCEALSKKYLSGEMSWDDLMKQDPLMMYSKEFMNCVAGLCGVDPGTGKPIPGSAPKTEPEPEPEPEHEPEPEETVSDIELDEAEETANDSNDASVAEDETEEEPESGDEAVEDNGEEPETPAWDMCAWCAQVPATVCIDVSISQGGDRRLMRVDHVCDECAGAYWEAIRNAQFSRMSPDPEPDEEEEE